MGIFQKSWRESMRKEFDIKHKTNTLLVTYEFKEFGDFITHDLYPLF